MTNVIQTQAVIIDTGIIAIARSALVEGVTKTGAVIKNYSGAIASVFDRRDTEGNVILNWWALDGKEAKGIKAERALFANTLMDRDSKFIKSTDATGKRTPTATVDTYWQRVKEASGYVPKGKVSGGTDVDAKTAAELKTMINRIVDAEENGKDCHASVILDSLKDAYVVLTGEAYNAGK